jgi:tRNA(Ile)-lysidine synthetase-like protein
LKCEPEINRTRVENLRDTLTSGSGEVVFGDIMVEASCGRVRIGPPLLEAEPFDQRILNVPGVTIAGPWRVTVSTEPLPHVDGAGFARADGTKLQGPLRVRPLQPGDRIRHNGLERKVSDFLVNEKVPAWERLGLVAVSDSAVIHALIGASREIGAPDSERALYIKVEAI